MKKLLLLIAAGILAAACAQNVPEECYIPRDNAEFSGNAFSLFDLGSDIRLFLSQNPDNNAQWTVQAVVPVRKVSATVIRSLDITLTPLDERGIRVRDGFYLEGEDIPNLLPVYNSGEGTEKTIVFNIPEEAKPYYTRKEAVDLLSRIHGARMNFNVEDPETSAEVAVEPEPEKKDEPLTLNSLLTKHGVYGLLSRYDRLLKNKDKKAAKKVEDQLWEIEKQVGNDKTIPQWLRDRFKDYIEDKEDEIEARY